MAGWVNLGWVCLDAAKTTNQPTGEQDTRVNSRNRAVACATEQYAPGSRSAGAIRIRRSLASFVLIHYDFLPFFAEMCVHDAGLHCHFRSGSRAGEHKPMWVSCATPKHRGY